MFSTRRKALLVSVALVGAAGLMTACQDSDAAATGSSAAQNSSPAAPSGEAPASSSPSAVSAGNAGASTSSSAAGGGQGSGSDSGSAKKGSGGGSGGGSITGSGGRGKVSQACGANDLALSTKSMTQAGGYILITAKAKPGITCYLPGEDPFVSFGTDTVAHPAEQSVSKQIQLSGSTTAYAGLNPKSTNTNGGKQWNSVTIGTAVGDPNASEISLGTTVTVDAPVVTNWHALADDAVPFS